MVLNELTDRWTERGRPPEEGSNRELIAMGAEPTRADAVRLAAGEDEAGNAPQGTLVVSAQATGPEGQPLPGKANAGFFVLNDDPALTGSEVVDPASEADSEGRAWVTFELSEKGREAYEEMTRQVADQGRKRNVCPPGQACATVLEVNSYDIVFGRRVLTRRIVDHTQFPDGMDANAGIAIDVPTAEDAKTIANSLEVGTG